eukprot:612211-Prymnesium_polylepis.1
MAAVHQVLQHVAAAHPGVGTLDRYFEGKPWHFVKSEKKQQLFASASSRAHREWKVSKVVD